MHTARIERARTAMRIQDIDAIFLTPSADFLYLTGMNCWLMERLVCLVLTQTTEALILPTLESASLPSSAAKLEVIPWSDSTDPYVLVKKVLKSSRKIAIGRQVPGWAILQLLQICPQAVLSSADDILTPLRLIKDDYEYGMLKEVQYKACRGLARVMEAGLAGRTEAEVSRLLQDFCAEEGVASGSGGVASGVNSANPHHTSGKRLIQKGDVVTIDFGGFIPGSGYNNDTTRTFCVGHIPSGFSEIYDIVNRANQAAFEAIQVGTPCQDVDRAARKVIEDAGYGKYFPHRLGHGLGLDIHEQPYMTEGNTMPIQAGFVFSDEPGIYIPGVYGVRIEDQIFVHPDGPERLTPTEPPLDHSLKIVD